MTVPLRVWAILGSLALVFVSAGAYLLGVHNSEQANWHTVSVDLARVAADEEGPHRLLSIKVDGWTYAIEDGVHWIDAHGTEYGDGWPECLEPRHPGFMDKNHETVRFRFAEVTVEADDSGWRPVLMVDCRPASS
jgi:hypothetical protein